MTATVLSRPARFRARGALVGLISAIALATPAGAQLVSTVDVGAASLDYENDYAIRAVSVSPSVQYDRGRASLWAVGTLSRFESGAMSSGGSLFGSMLAPPFDLLRRTLHGELALSLAGTAHEDNTRAAQYVAQFRAHVPAGNAGVWLGGGVGRAWNGDTWRPLSLAEAGVWWRRGPALLSAAVSPAAAGDTSWTDIAGSARWTRGALELGGSIGVRAGAPGDDDGAWGAAHGTLWITRHAAVSASAGTHRADHAAATSGGRYLSIGIRLASRPPLLDVARLGAVEPPLALTRPVAGRLTVGDGGAGRRTIRIEAPGARRVELMGDFTEWKVVTLQPARLGGAWELTLPLPSGSHRFNVRVDGGDWGIPLGVTAITDDFDGVVGILIAR